ncbi:MAG: ribonuclease HII [Nitrospirota bacterium]
MDLYRYDEALIKDGASIIAGIDEAGRGPLAGPVVAAAVILRRMEVFDGLRDSKKVPPNERKRLFWELLCRSVDIGVGIVEAEIIDRINILNATKSAMAMAVRDLSIKPDILVIDAVKLNSSGISQVSIIKGESKSASIAAASIIAKVVRDGIMEHYEEIYPEYGFAQHKGYATSLHINRIALHGPCPIHRKSFKKVMPLQLPLA